MSRPHSGVCVFSLTALPFWVRSVIFSSLGSFCQIGASSSFSKTITARKLAPVISRARGAFLKFRIAVPGIALQRGKFFDSDVDPVSC
jgi:hypothetical protein